MKSIPESASRVNAHSNLAHMPQEHDTQQFFDILHRGAPQRYIQDLNAGPNHDKRRSAYYRVDEPVTLPTAWRNEHSNIFHCVNPVIVRREYFQAGHNRDVGALNTLYREYDAKDFSEPSQAEIDVQFEVLRADPAKAKSTDKALRNEALGNAKDATYKSNPEHYKALVKAHVDQLTPAPSVIVFSGGGYQCYWLLAETLIIRTRPDEPNAHIESYAADLQKRFVQLDPKADQGVHDLRRILRTPGTYNHKKKYAPDYPQVTFYQKHFDLRYSLQGLKTLLPAPVATQPSQHTHQPATVTQGAPYEGPSVINAYNAATNITDILAAYGYTLQAGRMMRPGGEQSGVDIDRANNRSRHWSSNDPLYSVFWRRPFDVLCTYAHEGDVTAAVRVAAAALGMKKAQPGEALIPDVTPIIDTLRLWIKTHNLTECLPAGPGSKKARLVADAVFDLMQQDQRLSITAGKKRLAKYAGVDANTAAHALALLNGVLFDVTQSEEGCRITLLENCRLQEIHPSFLHFQCLTTGGEKTENDKNAYSPHKADEPFLTGASRYMKDFIQTKSLELTIWQDGELIQEVTPDQVKEQYTFAGLGEGVLLAYDTSLRVGDMTAQEYAEETGLKLSTARTHLHRAETMGLATAEREGSRGPKLYSFIPDFWEKIDELAPCLRTHKLGNQRENKRLESAQQWTKAELEKAKQAGELEKVEELRGRFNWHADQRIPHLARLYEGLSKAELIRLAYDVAAYKRSTQTAQAIRTERSAQRTEHRETVKLIADLAVAIADVGTPLEEVFDEVMKYDFDGRMVRDVLQSPKQMANYETVEDLRLRMRAEDLAIPTLIANNPPSSGHNQMAFAGAA